MTMVSQLVVPGRSARGAALRGNGAGAVAGQLSQALASFVLQLLAARVLGAKGLGLFALIYSVLVMTSAISTGLIGDSLTILDRRDAAIRAGLQGWSLVTVTTAGATAALATYWSHTLDGRVAAWFGVAMMAFLLEDVLRRLLMATMRFWSLVAVDCTGLLVSLLTLVVASRLGPLDIQSFVGALLLGQVAAGAVAIPLLPQHERSFGRGRPMAFAVVGRFGAWRAAQQGIRPTMLTIARVLITLAVGRIAFGELEAGRVYMAPTMLVVQGLGTYLLSSFARRPDVPLHLLLRRADRASGAMLLMSATLAVTALVCAPVLGPLLTGGGYALAPLTLAGWALYAASGAAVMPFASLAAVRGRQSLVVGLRAADSVFSLACLVLVLFPLHLSVGWAPIALSAGSFIGAWLIRARVLKPLVETAPR